MTPSVIAVCTVQVPRIRLETFIQVLKFHPPSGFDYSHTLWPFSLLSLPCVTLDASTTYFFDSISPSCESSTRIHSHYPIPFVEYCYKTIRPRAWIICLGPDSIICTLTVSNAHEHLTIPHPPHPKVIAVPESVRSGEVQPLTTPYLSNDYSDSPAHTLNRFRHLLPSSHILVIGFICIQRSSTQRTVFIDVYRMELQLPHLISIFQAWPSLCDSFEQVKPQRLDRRPSPV